MNGPWESFLDGIGNGLGYAKILIIVAFFRELLGAGTLFGFQVIPQAVYDLGYLNNGLMLMPATIRLLQDFRILMEEDVLSVITVVWLFMELTS